MDVTQFGHLIKQAKQVQTKLTEIQAEAAKKNVEASSGGGMVVVTANGNQEIVSIKIESSIVTKEDIPMLQDLIVAATNQALVKSKEMIAEEMNKLTGGMKIPGLTF